MRPRKGDLDTEVSTTSSFTSSFGALLIMMFEICPRFQIVHVRRIRQVVVANVTGRCRRGIRRRHLEPISLHRPLAFYLYLVDPLDQPVFLAQVPELCRRVGGNLYATRLARAFHAARRIDGITKDLEPRLFAAQDTRSERGGNRTV